MIPTVAAAVHANTDAETATAAMQPRLRDAVAFLTALAVPGECREIRCLGAGGYDKRIDAGWSCNPQMLAKMAVYHDVTLKPRGSYVTFNACDPALQARASDRIKQWQRDLTQDQHIWHRCWLLIDIDPVRPSGIMATDAERDAAVVVAEDVRDWLMSSHGWGEPIEVDSGNGGYLLFPIDLPNDDEFRELVSQTLKAIAQHCDTPQAEIDTTVSNASRIMRIPGTTNRKGDDARAIGRPWRVASLLYVPDYLQQGWAEPVPVERLRAVADLVVDQHRGPAVSEAVSQADARGGPASMSVMERARKYLATIPPAVSGQGGHSQTLLAAEHMARGFVLSDEDAFMLLAEWNQGSQPPWSDGELRHKISEARTKGTTVAIGQHLRNDRPKQQAEIEVAWTSLFAAEGRTDIANARRFVRDHGDKVRYCHPWSKWLLWDGTRWHIDDSCAATRLAKTTADSVWIAALECMSDEVIGFAKRTSGHGALAAMLKLAAADLPVSVSDLDANPWLLNCPNGTVDLRTGQLHEHRREDSVTKLCPTEFDPSATCPHFERFLLSVFDENQEAIDFLRRFVGYCLTGDVREQILAVFHGAGSNGKSTLLKAIENTMGTDFAVAAPPSLLMEKKTDAHPTELAGLFGKRLVIAQETNAGARLAEATVKQLTGGDTITARRMREDFWQFDPTHKVILVTNHRPGIAGTDHAIWRRLVLIPFNRRFWNPQKAESGPPELQQDKTLPQKLAAERQGILAWAVRGCTEWQRDGLQIPECVRAATAEYRSEQDTLGRFVKACCLCQPAARVKFSALYEALTQWANDGGEGVPSKRFAGAWLKDNGYQQHTNNGRWYLGIGLKTE